MYDLLTPLTEEHLQSIILFADLFCFYVCFGYLLCVHIRSLIASMERFIFLCAVCCRFLHCFPFQLSLKTWVATADVLVHS